MTSESSLRHSDIKRTVTVGTSWLITSGIMQIISQRDHFACNILLFNVSRVRILRHASLRV